MADARVEKVNITGIDDVNKLVKLDVSTYPNGGTVGYTDTNNTPDKSINDEVTIQGVKGVVNKIGITGSRSNVGSLVSADLGNKNAKKMLSVFRSINDCTFQPYLLSDILPYITTVNIELRGYDLLVEEYVFSGKTIDCLNDIAGLIFGTVEYISSEDKYVIVGGDTTYLSSKLGTGHISITGDNLISYDVVTELNTELKSFGSNLIQIAKELATLRAAILDIPANNNIDNVSTREVTNAIEFTFGKTVQEVPSRIQIESIYWDYWYFDAVNETFVDANTSTLFKKKQSRYFYEELLREVTTETTPNGGVGTVKRGYKRGLRSVAVGTSFYVRLYNIPTNCTVYGRGYLANLSSLGLPSVTEFRALAAASAATPNKFDDCYHILYDVETREVIVKESKQSSTTSKEYVPFLRFTVSPSFYNEVVGALIRKKRAAGDNSDPTDTEINELCLDHQYTARVEILTEEVSFNLKYKGAIDIYGRLISDSGQVQLVQAMPTNTGGGIGGPYFYGPIEGMDMYIAPSNYVPPNQTTPYSLARLSTGETINSSLLDPYFDENSLTSTLKKALLDLRALAASQTPIGMYDPKEKSLLAGYPKFIYAYNVDSLSGTASIGNPIGVIYESNSIVKLPFREAVGNLSLTAYESTDKLKRQLQRKLRCLESKLTLIFRCIKKLDPNNTVTIQYLKDMLKKIIFYNTVLGRTKNESLITLQELRTDYETALNACISMFDGESGSRVRRATTSILLPPQLPNIGDSMSLPVEIDNGTFRVKSVSVSGVTASITGEYYV